MGAIYVVRHAQASFGTEDYDRLSQTGFAQARLLGAYFALRGIRFDAVYLGTLRRHAETARGIFDGHAGCGDGPPPVRLPALDEYNPEALMSAYTDADPAPPAAAPAPPDAAPAPPDAVPAPPDAAPAPPVGAAGPDTAAVREHFRLLKQALLAWAEDRMQPAGMPSFRTFQDGAVAAVVEARSRFAGGSVLVVSSGGPIAAIVAAALRAPPQTAIELNLQIRNSSVTEFTMSSRRHQLVSFNALAHLDTSLDRGLVTYA